MGLLERLLLSMLSQPIPSKTSRPRSKTRKVFHQISKDLSSLVSNSRMEELFPTTTSRRNQLSTWSLDLEEVCKSSSRPSLSMSSQLTLLRTSRPRSKIRKVSHQTSKDISSPESNLRMVEPSLITTSRRNQPSTWSSDLEVDNELISA